MIVDQDEIDALLAEADGLVAEATDEAGTIASPAVTATPSAAAPAPLADVSPELARILRIRVPVRVQLASRYMNIAAIRGLSLGTIIEFYKSIEEPLDLLINNHPVGKGDAVKVEEHFGLRISEIRDAATRIRSMGR